MVLVRKNINTIKFFHFQLLSLREAARRSNLLAVLVGRLLRFARNDTYETLQFWHVALAGVFFPILAEAVFGGLLVGVGAQAGDIDVDAEPGRGRQVDPALVDREGDGGDVATDILEIDEILGDAEIRDDGRD